MALHALEVRSYARPGEEPEAVTGPGADRARMRLAGTRTRSRRRPRRLTRCPCNVKPGTARWGSSFSAAPPNKEFVPEMSVKPDSQKGMVGQPFREELRVLNWKDTPRGTTFHWGGQVLDEGIEFLGMPDTTRRGGSALNAMPRRPGTSSVKANLVHQVPGGPRKVWAGPEIPVATAPPPRLKVDFVSAPVRNNMQNCSRLSPGDRLIVTVESVGVGKRIGELNPLFTSTATSGVVDLDMTKELSPIKHEYSGRGPQGGALRVLVPVAGPQHRHAGSGVGPRAGLGRDGPPGVHQQVPRPRTRSSTASTTSSAPSPRSWRPCTARRGSCTRAP